MNKAGLISSILLSMGMSVATSITAFAEGKESHGGSAIVCFKAGFDISKALNKDGALSKAARVNIESAKMLEAYEVSENNSLRRFDGSSMEEIYARFTQNFHEIPYFEQQLAAAHKKLGWISTWSGSSLGVAAPGDSGRVVAVDEDRCIETYVANRQFSQLYYDKVVVENHFSELDRAILQLHEELYYLNELKNGDGGGIEGKTKRSINAKLVGERLLTRQGDSEDVLVEFLSENGFGTFITRNQARSRIAKKLEVLTEIEAYSDLCISNNAACLESKVQELGRKADGVDRNSPFRIYGLSPEDQKSIETADLVLFTHTNGTYNHVNCYSYISVETRSEVKAAIAALRAIVL